MVNETHLLKSHVEMSVILTLKNTIMHLIIIASIPGRIFAFITIRRTTRPGTSCLRMRQLFERMDILFHFRDIYIRVLSCTRTVPVLSLLESIGMALS